MAGNKNSGRRANPDAMKVASLSREHTETAIKQLAMLATNAESDSAKIQACIALLDRGWGKPAQATAEMPQEEAKQVFGWLPVQK